MKGSASEDEFDALVKDTAPQREKTARRAATKVRFKFCFLGFKFNPLDLF